MREVFPICHWSSAARAAKFDGVNDFLARGADLTGNADGQKGLVSFWFLINSDGFSGVRAFFSGGTGATKYSTFIRPNAQGFITGSRWRPPGLGLVLSLPSKSGYAAGSGWHHYLQSWDLGVAGARHLIIDGIDDLDTGSPNFLFDQGETIGYVQSEHTIAAGIIGTGKLDACLAEVYLNFAEFLDISVAANLEKFRTSGGKPENLGSDGSTPTGNVPIVYLSGGVPEFLTNKGSGGGFTKQGAPVSCETAPP